MPLISGPSFEPSLASRKSAEETNGGRTLTILANEVRSVLRAHWDVIHFISSVLVQVLSGSGEDRKAAVGGVSQRADCDCLQQADANPSCTALEGGKRWCWGSGHPPHEHSPRDRPGMPCRFVGLPGRLLSPLCKSVTGFRFLLGTRPWCDDQPSLTMPDISPACAGTTTRKRDKSGSGGFRQGPRMGAGGGWAIGRCERTNKSGGSGPPCQRRADH